MNGVYGRDLDLNLIRVFVVVAETGSVTEAARRLYLTQPAVSAALKRLATAVDAPLFSRSGRRLVLTSRGERLLASARPSLETMLQAALSPATFEPARSERIIRLGLSDKNEAWLLPPLLRLLSRQAPGMRLIVTPAQHLTVGEQLAAGHIDLAVCPTRELPAGIDRRPLYRGDIVCLFDPRRVKLGASPTRAQYLAQEHITVSYSGDLRSLLEDRFDVTVRTRISVPTVHSVGAIVDGSSLVATLPRIVARQIRAQRPHLRLARLPFPIVGTGSELLSRRALADDEAVCFVADKIARIAARFADRTGAAVSPARSRSPAGARARQSTGALS